MICHFPIDIGKFLQLVLFSKFSLTIEKCTNALRRRSGDGLFPPRVAKPRVGEIENSPWVTKGTSQFPCKSQVFPHEWFSRRGEKIFHHEWRSHEWWNLFLPQLLSHEWGKTCDAHGNWDVPWVTNGEFYPSTLRLRRALTFLYCKWRLHWLSMCL